MCFESISGELTDERRFHWGRASVAILVAPNLLDGGAVTSPVYRIWPITVVWTRPFLTDDQSKMIVERPYGLQLCPFGVSPGPVERVSKYSKQVG